MAEWPDERALRRTDRYQAQDHPEPGAALQHPQGRPACGRTEQFDRDGLLLRRVLHDIAGGPPPQSSLVPGQEGPELRAVSDPAEHVHAGWAGLPPPSASKAGWSTPSRQPL